MTPTSIPVNPAQPNQHFYGVGELSIVKTFTRDTYRAIFGVEAPAFDPARVIKTWFDSTADTSQPDNVAIYLCPARGGDGHWGVHQFVLPAHEAGTVNLPGVIKYPVYVVPPTAAIRGDSAINPNYLTLEADARALMAEVGGTGIAEENLALFPVTYPPSEQRRIWNIMFKGTPIYAGLLLLNKYGQGVGAPGHWDLTRNEPAWIADAPAPAGLFDTRSPRPIPIRPLLGNERFNETLMGVQIERTDLPSDIPASSGQFTADDRALLQAIFAATKKG